MEAATILGNPGDGEELEQVTDALEEADGVDPSSTVDGVPAPDDEVRDEDEEIPAGVAAHFKKRRVEVTDDMHLDAGNVQGVMLEERDPSGAYYRAGTGGPIVSPVPTESGWRLRAATVRAVQADIAARKRWGKAVRGGWCSRYPPLAAIDAVLARPEASQFPIVHGVSSNPILRPDGSVVQGWEYDPQTKWCVLADGERLAATGWPAGGPQKYTKEEAAEAIRWIDEEALHDFPFATEHDRSAAMAAMLTVAGRGAIPGPCPCFALEANVRGAGKGLMVKVVQAACGLSIPPMTYPGRPYY